MTSAITVSPSSCEKSRNAGELAIAAFGNASVGGHLQIATDIPIGQGMGSSTADVLASIHAVLDYHGAEPTPEMIMKIAVAAETACDATLFRQHAVVFAHREGFVIEAFRRPIPPLAIISIDTAPDLRVSTLEHQPAVYEPDEIEAFRPLHSLLRLAINTGNVQLLGRVATASARINERFLPKPYLQTLHDIARRFDAAGIQVAHSGTLAGIIFDPQLKTTPDNVRRATQAVDAMGLHHRQFLM
ncbi:GHMP kinase [Neorhizobium sp. BT27B]|uniref:GHMP family kinase ATP-binding protein n=1 Tax=Neorhizobium sp. BT27B TaxID=3142625 RepID=UPI003D2E80CC